MSNDHRHYGDANIVLHTKIKLNLLENKLFENLEVNYLNFNMLKSENWRNNCNEIGKCLLEVHMRHRVIK